MKKLIFALSLVASLVGFGETTTINIDEAVGMQKTLGADDVLIVNVSGDSDQSAVDWSGITGTGTIKFQGSGIVTLPGYWEYRRTGSIFEFHRFDEALSLVSEIDLRLTPCWGKKDGSANPFNVCDFSGNANLLVNNVVNGSKRTTYFRTKQTRTTEWSGAIQDISDNRVVEMYVASDGEKPSKDKALVVSGNQTSAQTLRIEPTGCVILKGLWNGTIENNGLLVIAPGVDQSQLTVTGSGVKEIQQATELIVIAPPALKAMWQEEYADKFQEIHPGYTCKVVGTDEIYAQYSYETRVDGKPRNAAESIHAYITEVSTKYGNQYFILGGPFIDAQNLDKVIKLQTGETLSLDNAVPGIIACNGSRYGSCESDLYYACLDSGNKYAWDADNDGEYLEADSVAKDGNPAHSTIPDVAVSRIPLLTWNEWKKDDGSVYSQRELLTAYVAKLKKGLAADFDGLNSYGCYGYTVYETDNKIYPEIGSTYGDIVRRDESEFYTGLKNMFDPTRESDLFWCAEPISRRHLKEQIAKARPIADTTILMDETLWSDGLSSREDARSALLGNDFALKFYYAHSGYGGGHGFSRDDFKAEGCGLALMDDCAGPCSTGALALTDNKDGTYTHDISYAHASVMSPFGGSLATVNNTRAGFFSSDFRGKFDSGCSFELESHMIEAFVGDGLTAGDAWKKMVSRYAQKRQTDSTHVWIYSEVMLQGDPLVKLPAIEDKLAYGVDGTTYKGLRGKTDAVVSMSVEGDQTIETEAKFKVMDGLTTSGSSLMLKTGEGGIGGDGVTFTGEKKGILTLAGKEPFYVAGVKNGEKVVVNGTATLDFDAFDISALEIGAGANVTIRSNTRGAFAKIGRSLTIPAGTTVRLETWDAFGDEKGKITVGSGAKLVIGANPSYHDGNNRGEALNADITFADGVEGCEIVVKKGAIYSGVIDARINYVIEAYDGLKGEIVVPDGGQLKLSEAPLKLVDSLKVCNGGAVILANGISENDFVAPNGTIVLEQGSKIIWNDEPTTTAAEKTINGNGYRSVCYYPNTTRDWVGAIKGCATKGGPADQSIEAYTTVRFAQDYGPVYCLDTIAAKHIEVVDGANLKIGYRNVSGNDQRSWTLPHNWSVDIEEGSTLTIARWDNEANVDEVKIGNDVILNGDGLVTFARSVSSVSCGNISGNARILLPHGTTLTTAGDISNPIVAPVDCEIDKTENGSSTTYSVRTKGAFGKSWSYFYTGAGSDMSASENWSQAEGGILKQMSAAPLLSGSELWEPALFDGERMALEAGEDGFKHITSTPKVEGWNLCIGLTNNVCVTIKELEKFQIGQQQYAYIDSTSRLVVEKFNSGKTLTMPFDIAAEEGLVWKADSAARGYTFVYSFSGNGSAKFIGTSDVAAHKIAAAEITLGEGEVQAILSKKLISFNSAKSNTTACGFADEVKILTDNPEVVGQIKSSAVTTDDPVGTCSLRREDDGIYLDYVGWGSKATEVEVFWNGTAGSVADWRTKTSISLRDSAVYEEGDAIVIDVDAIIYLRDALAGLKIVVAKGSTVRFCRSGDGSGADYVMKGISLEVRDGATAVIPRHEKGINNGWDTYQPAAKPKRSELNGSAIYGEGRVVIESGATLVLSDSTITVPIVVEEGATVGEDIAAPIFNAKGTPRNDLAKAYLLKCEISDIETKKAEFKFTAEDLEKLMKGETLETINGVEFNGKIEIVETPISGGMLYKAVLTL